MAKARFMNIKHAALTLPRNLESASGHVIKLIFMSPAFAVVGSINWRSGEAAPN